MSRPVAVIDIGSNSIKLLVASRAADGSITHLLSTIEETRISTGINAGNPVLSSGGISAGVEAIARLVKLAAAENPAETVLVATSAVRDAGNGAEFRAKVEAATGLQIRILTGDEEAEVIGFGLVNDPALATVQDFLVFDLGGGSLECIDFRGRKPVRAHSLQLGCVRLTERCVADPAAPFTNADRARIEREVTADLARRFPLDGASGLPVVATGGTVSTSRAILAARAGKTFSEREAEITVAELELLLETSGQLPLEARRAIPGLPAARVDVFPTALVTFLTLLRLAGANALRHSESNLRQGLAARLLGG